MATAFVGGDRTATDDRIRRGQYTIPVWKKHLGVYLTAAPAAFHLIHGVSDAPELDDIEFSALNQRDLFELGKNKITIDDGFEGEWTITLEGDALESIAAFIGQDYYANPVLEHAKDYGICGDLVLISCDTDRNMQASTIVTDVGVRLTMIPGGEDGERTAQVTLYTKMQTKADRIGKDYVPGHEIWYDNGGTVINAAAPDGVLTVFTLGDGNGSFSAATTPVAKQIRPAFTDYRQYFYYVRLDGQDVDVADVTFNVGLSQLTFTTAPTNGAKLEVAYVTAATVLAVNNMPHKSDVLVDWKDYY